MAELKNVVALHGEEVAERAARDQGDDTVLISPDEVPPAPAFPLDVFPPVVREHVEVVARAIPVPVDFVALPDLVVLATAIGTQRSVAIKPGWDEYPCLYAAVVGASGEGKSPALSAALRPLRYMQEQLLQKWRAEKDAWEKLPDDKKETIPRPVRQSVLATDATMEALAFQLGNSPHGMIYYRDELTSLLAQMDAYRGGRGGDRQRWLEIHSGQPLAVERMGREDAIFVRLPLVGVIGGFTPNHFRDFLGTAAVEQDDGFYHRFLLAYPSPLPPRSSRHPIPSTMQDAYDHLVAKLWDLPGLIDQDTGAPTPRLSVTAEAAALWWAWDENLQVEREALPPILRQK